MNSVNLEITESLRKKFIFVNILKFLIFNPEDGPFRITYLKNVHVFAVVF